MRQTVKQFETWLRASGYFVSAVTDHEKQEIGLFLDMDDSPSSKRKINQIVAMAKKLGVRIDLADKGITFF